MKFTLKLPVNKPNNIDWLLYCMWEFRLRCEVLLSLIQYMIFYHKCLFVEYVLYTFSSHVRQVAFSRMKFHRFNKNESRKAELIPQTLTDFNNVISDFAERQGASWDLWIVSAPRDKSNGCCFPPLRVYFGTVSVYKESGSHEAQMLVQNNSSRFRRLIK